MRFLTRHAKWRTDEHMDITGPANWAAWLITAKDQVRIWLARGHWRAWVMGGNRSYGRFLYYRGYWSRRVMHAHLNKIEAADADNMQWIWCEPYPRRKWK